MIIASIDLTPAAIAQYVTTAVSLLAALGAIYVLFSRLFRKMDALFETPRAVREMQTNVKAIADSLKEIAATQKALNNWGDEHLRREHGQK